jgi:type IV secretory pathway ATPase VirB11/archaellum biosynthesis ATPase
VEKLGVSLGSNSDQVIASVANMKKVDFNRTLIVLSKNLEEKENEKTNQEFESLGHLNELSSDLAEEGNQSSQHTEPKMVNKTLKVYKRKQKVAPKVVRRSVRLNNKK